MEIFDVVDEQDNVVGEATREECHSDPKLIHRAVQFTLLNKSKKLVLLTRRSFCKSTDPGKWCFPGEHVLKGESYEQAVGRGCLEELGIKATETSMEGAENIFRMGSFTERVKFFLVPWEGNGLKYDESEIAEIRWVLADALNDGSFDFSEMARYFIDNVSWNELGV